ncbi:MAG: flagellar biosynthesis protein FliQ [Firmicutes bacterium]|nr:flagellar biosynthesis protein FliQ [Bacillota bacterium]
MELSDTLAALNTALIMVLRLAAPILLLSMLVGLVIAIFQAATQIHEQTLTFVPKLLVILFVIMITGNWMMSSLMEFISEIFKLMANG